MNSTLKTGLVAFFALIISLSFVYFFLVTNEYHDTLEESRVKFVFSEFDDSKKNILIIGSSQVGAIKMFYVNEQVSKVCTDCVVYNLVNGADNPYKRLKKLNLIKNMEPDLVFYGISYRDFANLNRMNEEIIQIKTPKSILPDPQEFFQKEILIKAFNTDINPKAFSFKFLIGVLDDKESSKVTNPYRLTNPAINPKSLSAFSNAELIEKFPRDKRSTQLAKIDPIEYTKNVNALKAIIKELKNNEIEVVIFTIPLPQVFLDKVSNSDKELFTDTLHDISQEFDVQVYRLDEKFSDMDIWRDYWHVTKSEKGLVYGKEIVQIIKNEIE